MKVVINPKYEQARSNILQLIESFETKGKTIHEGRNIVKSFQTDYGEWIIKRYKKPLFFQRFIYTFFRKSKAERAYIFAGKLHSLGVETPEGIAYAEDTKDGLMSYCYFTSTACTYSALYSVLVENTDYDKNLVKALARFFKELHSKGFLHGDSNLNNILYTTGKQQTDFKFAVIDTNRSKFKKKLTHSECLDNFKRTTHRRDLLEDLITQYAILQNWDIPDSVNHVIRTLNKFEEKKRIKHFIKREK